MKRDGNQKAGGAAREPAAHTTWTSLHAACLERSLADARHPLEALAERPPKRWLTLAALAAKARTPNSFAWNQSDLMGEQLDTGRPSTQWERARCDRHARGLAVLIRHELAEKLAGVA
jgi:hypothetical protein